LASIHAVSLRVLAAFAARLAVIYHSLGGIDATTAVIVRVRSEGRLVGELALIAVEDEQVLADSDAQAVGDGPFFGVASASASYVADGRGRCVIRIRTYGQHLINVGAK